VKTLFLSLCLAVSSFGAITANTIWEVRTTGTATNGGGFDATISGAGTDMSQFNNKNAAGCTACQSTTVNISTTDFVTTNTTTVTSATANFSSALIGNTIYLSGTGVTTGWYQVTAVASALSITVDRATGSTGGTAETGNIGGALRNMLDAANYTAGNIIYVKATATYTISASMAFTTTTTPGASGAPITFVGYNAVRSDYGQVTIQETAISLTAFSGNGTFLRFLDFIVDCNSETGSIGFGLTGEANIVSNIEVKNCKGTSISVTATQNIFKNFWVHGMTACTTGAVDVSAVGVSLEFGRINGNSCIGLIDSATSTTAGSHYLYLISDDNTSHGFEKTSTSFAVFIGCVAYDNGGHGLLITAAGGVNAITVLNSIFVDNSGYGIASQTTSWAYFGAWVDMNYNGYYNNMSGPLFQLPQGLNDVTSLTGVPFVNASAGNFALNNTPGQGALLRAAGFPGALLSGGTGYVDIGTLQHQTTGGQTGAAIVQ
jgi:hypothetical protein